MVDGGGRYDNPNPMNLTLTLISHDFDDDELRWKEAFTYNNTTAFLGTSGFNMKPPLKLSSAVFGDEEEEDSMSTSGKAAAPHVSFKPKISSLESVSCEMMRL